MAKKSKVKLNAVARLEKPLAIDATEKELTTRVDDGIGEYIQNYRNQIEDAVKDRSVWSNKVRLGYMRRRGLIGKEDKNFPFARSSDLRYPIEEIKIREKKPGYVSVLLNTPKVVRYTPINPDSQESKDRLEHFCNYLFRTAIKDFYFTSAATADKLLESGTAYVKVTWEHKTEWRTRVLLKSDFDKIKVQVTHTKLQAVAAKMQATQAAMQTQQPPTDQAQTQQPPDEEQPETPAQGSAQPVDQVPEQMPMPSMDQIRPTEEELIQAFAQSRKIDLEEDPEKRAQVKSSVSQYLAGNETITFLEEVTVSHRPCVTHIQENQSVIYPVTASTVEDAEWVAHEMFYTEREMRAESEENGGRFRQDSVDALFEAMGEDPAGQQTADRQDMVVQRESSEGINSNNSVKGSFRVIELYCWLPRRMISRFIGIGGDDELPVRAVMTFCADSDAQSVPPLRITEFPYDHGTWPIHKYDYNYSIDRSYAHRGICELIEPFAREYCQSSNAAIDRRTLTNSPPTIIWDQSDINATAFRQVGQAMVSAVPADQAISIPQFPDLASGFEFDAQKCMAWIDRTIGTSQVPSLANRQSSPSATEVNALEAPVNSIDNFEHTTWLLRWGKVFEQVHKLCQQYWFTTQDNFAFPVSDQPGQFQTVTQEDFDKQYIIMAGGDPGKENPLMELQKAYILLQTSFQYPQLAGMYKTYDLAMSWTSKLIGYAEAAGITNTRQIADKIQQQVMQMAAQQTADKAQGKRSSGRQPRVKQVPGTGAGIVPK